MIDYLCRRLQAMKATRAPWESHWREIERRVNPRGDLFAYPARGAKGTFEIFDSTAVLGNERFAAAMSGLVAPKNQVWHRLEPSDRRAGKSINVRRYLDEVNDALWEYRYAATAGFQTQLHETMLSLGSIGTAPLWIEGAPGRGVIYRALHPREIYIDVDSIGQVDTVAREFDYTPRQAIERFGAEQLPRVVLEADASQPGRTFRFTHFISPRSARDDTRLDARNMPIGSWYWMDAEKDKLLVRESGFNSFPMPVVRYTTAPGEMWGRSVAMMALPDIKMANEMAKSILRATHLALDPPLLLPDDGVMTRMQTKPGALNYCGVNMRGEQLVRALDTGGNLPAGSMAREQTRRVINDAFLVTLFQVFVDGPDRMTATEVLERVREKGVLLAPAAGRIETELLGPMIERELDILSRAGLLPDMPDELAEMGGNIKIVYDNPMARAAQMEKPMAFFRTMEALAPIAAVDQSVLDGFNLPAAARGVAEITGVPAAWLRSDEEIDAVAAQRQQQQQAQQFIDALPKVAGASLDIARAEGEGGGLPQAA